MAEGTLVLGGCRSGKSSHALQLADALVGRRKVFVATCVPTDTEMRRRVARHQSERGDGWQTIETAVDVAEVLVTRGPHSDVILVDCLTLWTSNLLMESTDEETLRGYGHALADAVDSCPCPVFLVSNEVGLGVVPENRLARLFRDVAGWVNQEMAARCGRVIWMVAGIPVTIKPINAGWGGAA